MGDATFSGHAVANGGVPSAGWFFIHPEHLPERWKARAQEVFLVPLLPDEAAELFHGSGPGVTLSHHEEALAQLVAKGASLSTIGALLDLHPRTVSRHIARLRDRFGVVSTPELVAILAEAGFASKSDVRS